MHLTHRLMTLVTTLALLGSLGIPGAPPLHQPPPVHADDPSFAATVINLILRIVNIGTGQEYPPGDASGTPPLPQQTGRLAAAEPGRTTVTVTTQDQSGGLVTNTASQALGSGIRGIAIPADIPGLKVPAGYNMIGRVETGFSRPTRASVSYVDQGFTAAVTPQRITDTSGAFGVPGATLTMGIAGEGLEGATAVAFSGSGVRGTVNKAASTASFLSVDVTISLTAEFGPRSFSVHTPRGPVFSPAGLVFTVRDPRTLGVADPSAPARLAAEPGQPGPTVKYALTYVTKLQFVRPAGAVGPSEFAMPVNLSGLQLRTSPVPGTSARVSYDWKVESPQVQSTPLFQSSAVAELGKPGIVTGNIPASNFDLSQLGVVRLKDDLVNVGFVLPPVSESLPVVDVTVTFTISGEGAVTDATAQPLSPADGAQLGNFSPVLAWKQPAETVAYHVQVVPLFGDGPAIDLLIGNARLVARSEFAVQAPFIGTGNYVLLPGATYTWRVRLCVLAESCSNNASSAWTGWSTPWQFTTPRASSATVTLASPPSGGAAASNPPTLKWNDLNLNVFYYEVQLSSDWDFGQGPRGPIAAVQSRLLHGGLTNPLLSFTPNDPLPAGLYHWRVRPRLQATPLGPAEAGVAWSAVASFTQP